MSKRRDLLEEEIKLAEAILAAKKGEQAKNYYATDQVRADYEAHLDIFRAGADFRERAAFGGNRTGKSFLGSFETALHLIGKYPDWWTGHRFDRPVVAWSCGTTLDSVRDICQEALLGPPTAPGTGMIPREAIVAKRRKSGVADLYDSVSVKHVSGGISTLQFKPYSAGRESFQGRKIQFCWLDEECDWPVYEEILLRTTKTSDSEEAGKILVTMTPLKGLSDVATHFLQDGQLVESDDRFGHLISWDDVPHLDDKEKAELLKSIPLHQQEARVQGYPSLGSGAIYQYSEESLVIKPHQIPGFWNQAYGMDVGYVGGTAAIRLAIDPDQGKYVVTGEYIKKEAKPQEHALSIKLLADTGNGVMSGCVDPAAQHRSQKDGARLIDEYRVLGLKLFPAINQVEAGLFRIQQLISSGQLKIFDTCPRLLAEMRMYQRDDRGKVIKRNDHLCDALRYAVMTDRIHTRPRPANYRPKNKASRYAWSQ